MVTWKNKEDNPLPYWVMDYQQAKDFTNNLPIDLKCMNLDWDAGNWNILLTKVSKTQDEEITQKIQDVYPIV